MFDLTGKRALVTGSTQGIGFEIAKTLAAHGANVFVHGASNVEKCTNASKQIAGSSPVLANLLEVEEIDALYEKTGDVDILVLNASIQYKRNWDEFTLEEYEQQIEELNTKLKSSKKHVDNNDLIDEQESQIKSLRNLVLIICGCLYF